MTNIIEIWEPKYSTNSVLIGSHKVTRGVNKIVFTKSKSLAGKVYTIDSAEIIKHPTQPNGKGKVYVVPFDRLTLDD